MLNISVAMTVYNGQEYIMQQLCSIKSQIRKPDEVVIIDDGSTDDTVSIIRNFIEENNLLSWRLVENEKNLGFIKNFKKAISLTSGDLVFISDQDDVWCQDKIETLADIFAKGDDVKAVSSAFTIIDKNSQMNDTAVNAKNNHGLLKNTFHKYLQKVSLKTVIHRNISPGCTSAFRREVADLYVKNSNCTLPHDYELNVIAAALNGLYFCNAPLVKYRIHENNTLGFNSLKQTRIDIAEEKLEASFAVMNSTGNTVLYDMYLLRLKALKEKSLHLIIKLWFNRLYRKFLSLHERLGDTIYVMRKSNG